MVINWPLNVLLKAEWLRLLSTLQSLLAARSGADYESPFLGRLDDVGNTGLNIVKDIVNIFSIHHIKTEVIAASIRNPIMY